MFGKLFLSYVTINDKFPNLSWPPTHIFIIFFFSNARRFFYSESNDGMCYMVLQWCVFFIFYVFQQIFYQKSCYNQNDSFYAISDLVGEVIFFISLIILKIREHAGILPQYFLIFSNSLFCCTSNSYNRLTWTFFTPNTCLTHFETWYKYSSYFLAVYSHLKCSSFFLR